MNCLRHFSPTGYYANHVMACSTGHRFSGLEIVSGTDLDGQVYIPQPYAKFDPVLCDPYLRQGIKILNSNQEEGEDWVLAMIAAGFGVSLVPAFTPNYPGVAYRPFGYPMVARDVSLVTVAGRRWPPVIAAFANLIRRHQWSPARRGHCSAEIRPNSFRNDSS